MVFLVIMGRTIGILIILLALPPGKTANAQDRPEDP